MTHTPFPPVGELVAPIDFHGELRAHKTLVTVDFVWGASDERPHFLVAGPRYRCAVPACPCGRTPCVGSGRWGGRCAELASAGTRWAHGHDFCHAGHAQHVMVLAAEALKTYGPNGRKVSSRTPGVPRGSRFLSKLFLPLDGQEQVYFHAGWSDEREVFHVLCDSARCRDSEGCVRRVASDFATQSLAITAIEEHKAWHAEQRAARLVGA